MFTLHQHGKGQVVLDATDIGATNVTTKYLDMKNFGAVDFFVTLGTTLEGTADGWNAADKLDTFKLVQATDAAGSDVKDVTGGAVTTPTLGVAGATYAVTCPAEALDIANSFFFVAVYLAETDNTGTDFVNVAAVQFQSRFKWDDLTSATQHVA